MRERLLEELAQRAAMDTEFLREMRGDPEGTLARHGFDLTADELRLVQNLRRQTAALGDAQLAQLLAGGLEERNTSPPARPASPGRNPRTGPARPARPGGLRRRDH